MKVGDKITHRTGAGVLIDQDTSGHHFLVAHDNGDKTWMDAPSLTPVNAPGSVEAVDANGEHWLVKPPKEGDEFWSMVCLTQTKAEAKAEAKADAAQAVAQDKQDKAEAKAEKAK